MSGESLIFSTGLLVKAESIRRGTPLRLSLSLTPADEVSLAERFDFLSVSEVSGSATLKLCATLCWELTAKVKARIEQACVVSSETVVTYLTFDVLERFVPESEKIEEIDATGVDVERLHDGFIPIGDAISQAIAICAPAYPRSEAAPILEEPEVERNNNPFAKLSELKK